MFVVIFEVQPKKERWGDYLNLAKQLKPKLEAIDGFLDNERFRSRGTMAAGVTRTLWSLADIVRVVDEWETAPKASA